MKSSVNNSGAKESYTAFDFHEIRKSSEPSIIGTQRRISHDNVKIDPNPAYVVSNALRTDEEPVYETTDAL